MAIKILEVGDLSKKKTFKFKCVNCGCVFECGYEDTDNGRICCPNCGNRLTLFDSDEYNTSINTILDMRTMCRNIIRNIDFDLDSVYKHICSVWCASDKNGIPDVSSLYDIVEKLVEYAFYNKATIERENFKVMYREEKCGFSVTIEYTDGDFHTEGTLKYDLEMHKFVE
jgi:predicted  nucleic acid-binding Zn-ribbon protein